MRLDERQIHKGVCKAMFRYFFDREDINRLLVKEVQSGLIVKPEYRRQGLGSRLIQKVEKLLAEKGEPCVFAPTDIPTLYPNLGWNIIHVSARGHVVGPRLILE